MFSGKMESQEVSGRIFLRRDMNTLSKFVSLTLLLFHFIASTESEYGQFCWGLYTADWGFCTTDTDYCNQVRGTMEDDGSDVCPSSSKVSSHLIKVNRRHQDVVVLVLKEGTPAMKFQIFRNKVV
jgi:hypothetical protein